MELCTFCDRGVTKELNRATVVELGGALEVGKVGVVLTCVIVAVVGKALDRYDIVLTDRDDAA